MSAQSGLGTWLPPTSITAADLARTTGIPEDVIALKFGIKKKPVDGVPGRGADSPKFGKSSAAARQPGTSMTRSYHRREPTFPWTYTRGRALRALVPALEDMAFFSLLVDDAMRMAAPAWIGNARALGAVDYTSGCAAFRKPVLVVWGRRDAIISESMARRTAEAFPRARLEMMEHVGHSPPVEDPDGFVRLLSGFIAGLGKEHG